MYQKIIRLFCLSCTLFALGCNADYIPITGEQLNSKILESEKNSSRSWWIALENEENYFLVEKSPLSKEEYSVSKKEISIRNVSAKNYPVNLKYKDIEFLKSHINDNH